MRSKADKLMLVQGATARKAEPEVEDTLVTAEALDNLAWTAPSAAPVKAKSTGPSENDQRTIARMKGYVGEACPECANFTLVRNGTCLKCDTCGSTTGCS